MGASLPSQTTGRVAGGSRCLVVTWSGQRRPPALGTMKTGAHLCIYAPAWWPPQVSDGELRQPSPEIMRKLSGAKDKLSLRVHGLIVGR